MKLLLLVYSRTDVIGIKTSSRVSEGLNRNGNDNSKLMAQTTALLKSLIVMESAYQRVLIFDWNITFIFADLKHVLIIMI